MPAFSIAEIEEMNRRRHERDQAAADAKKAAAAPAPKVEKAAAPVKEAPKKSILDKLKPAKKSSSGSNKSSSKKN